MVAVLLGASSSAAEESAYENAYQAGQDLEKASKFPEARAEFEKALAVPGITPDQAGQAMIKIGGTFLSVRKAQGRKAEAYIYLPPVAVGLGRKASRVGRAVRRETRR